MSRATDLILGYDVIALRDRKGSDPDEWPADLRVRELPAVQCHRLRHDAKTRRGQ